MECRGLVITRMAVDIRGWRVEEISHMEHELVETSNSLKSSLEAVLAFESKMAKAGTDLEFSR